MQTSTSAICTLYEGTYHVGVGALFNSLYANGFRGTMWVGYRGDLPPWATVESVRPGHDRMLIGADASLEFLYLDTQDHFTNYKAHFMRDLFDKLPGLQKLFYFDPDIVVRADWAFLDSWADYGVALCEDINSPLYPNHPLRRKWMDFYHPLGFYLEDKLIPYFNGGFVGLHRENKAFAEAWIKAMELMQEEIGGLDQTKVPSAKSQGWKKSRTYLFETPDQDGMNIAAMHLGAERISPMGKEAMDFVNGGYVMSHALGKLKPWNKRMFGAALKGRGLRMVDKLFWEHVQSPISVYTPGTVRKKKMAMQAAKVVEKIVKR